MTDGPDPRTRDSIATAATWRVRGGDRARRTTSTESPLNPGNPVRKHVDLGRCGKVVLHLWPDHKRLLIEFDVQPEGFDKSGLNAFIDALEKVRKKMDR